MNGRKKGGGVGGGEGGKRRKDVDSETLIREA